MPNYIYIYVLEFIVDSIKNILNGHLYLKNLINDGQFIHDLLRVRSMSFGHLLERVNVDHGEVIVVLMNLGYGSVEHPHHHLASFLFVKPIKGFAVFRVLQLFSRETTVMPIEDTDLQIYF